MAYYPTILTAVAALVLIPTAVWLEKNEPSLWHERLALPLFTEEPNRHTPRFPLATYLPPSITESITVGGPNTILAISNTTHIPTGVTVTLAEGTTLAFHEHAKLIIEGTLHAEGTPTERIQFVSNETHPENKTWGGLQFSSTANGTLNYTELQYGNPAISCLGESNVEITNSILRFGNVGLYSESASCALRNSSIVGTFRSVIARTNTPTLINNHFIASRPPLILE
ncbi:MAG: hypothetical protein WEC84_02205 [Candidatus Andersenbacteria bacterium]